VGDRTRPKVQEWHRATTWRYPRFPDANTLSSGRGWNTYIRGYSARHRHGIYPLGALEPRHLNLLAQVTGIWWTIQSLESVLLLDVETTGLQIEDGAIVFLIGLARFDSSHDLRLWQHLLVDPAEEASYLDAAYALMQGAEALITFNGRAFDAEVLGYRFACHCLNNPIQTLPHIDLLTLARRLWRGILPSCSLGSLESALLDIYRWDDLAGWQIPGAYREWLRMGDEGALRGILEHNAADILSMVSLAVHVANLLEEPTSYAKFTEELIKVAHCWERIGELERAVALYESTARDHGLYRQGGEILAKLARIYATHGAADKAVQAWTRLVESQWPHPEPYLELARMMERQDVRVALRHARQALAVATSLGMRGYAKRANALIRRLSGGAGP
jgi:uncharacterized protein YprB with RNaseH-like and TPR domain